MGDTLLLQKAHSFQGRPSTEEALGPISLGDASEEPDAGRQGARFSGGTSSGLPA